MHVSYDTSLRIAGIALVPWNRLGLERWLPNYRIASLYDWGATDLLDLPELICLPGDQLAQKLTHFNTQALLQTTEFQGLLQTRLPDYSLLTYKPVSVPSELEDHQFLMVDESFTGRYENKVFFRESFASVVPFPSYSIHARTDLPTDEAGFKTLLAERKAIVIQDEQLSGGKGTFIVTNFNEYTTALVKLAELSRRSKVVISSAIPNAKERSIQCCITNEAVYSGPLQRQIVRHPELCNLSADGDKFCGAVIALVDQQTPQHQTAQHIAQQIGQDLQAAGYRGIFGIDFLQDQAGELFVLEVNPRITGVTPLLTALYQDGDVPFYLLHTLELGGFTYSVSGQQCDFSGQGTLLIVHSLANQTLQIQSVPLSGTYEISDNKLVRVSGNVRLANLVAGQFIVQDFVLPGMRAKPGARLAAIQSNELMIDNLDDSLYNHTSRVIALVQESIVTTSG